MHSKNSEKIFDYLSNTYVQIGLLGGLLVLYLLTHSQIFGVLTVVSLLGFVGYEFYSGTEEHGLGEELKEIIITVVVVVILWEAISIILGTSTPISGIATCSMKPNLNRGDLIFMNKMNVSSISAPTVKMSEKEVHEITPTFYINGTIYENDGSLYNLCMNNISARVCKDFVSNPERYHEAHGPIMFNYGKCSLIDNGQRYVTPCVISVTVQNKTIPMKKNRSTIAYHPKKTDIFSLVGDISHRVQLIIKTENNTYYLTKGDNNEIFDVQMFGYSLNMGNSPVNQNQLNGKVFFKVPYIGYYKLFLSGMFNAVPQCKTQLTTPNFE